MRKVRILFFAVVGLLMTAMPALAQGGAPPAEGSGEGLKAIAAGVGFAIAVVGGALGAVEASCARGRSS